MRGRNGMVILAILCIVLSGITYFAVGKKDTSAPEIVFERKSIYYDGEDTSTLLDGVSALDDRDGDVTDSIIITSIYQTSEKTGIVIYAAKDQANNVTTLGRGFFYEGYDMTQILGLPEAEPSNPGEAEPADISGTEITDSDAEETGEIPESGRMTDEDYERIKEQNLAQGIPFIKLLEYEAAIERGSSFNIYRYIEEAVDDVDTIRTMLRVRGNVDTTVPGVYEVTVFAKDSDGNESNMEKIMITVE